MPTSAVTQLNEIIYLVMTSNPGSILDIGIGFGKYGFLSREYLELWNGNTSYKNWKIKIDGIEAFKDYLTPMHDLIYNNIYTGNAEDILQKLPQKYDLILLIDIIEHFDYKDGLNLLKECGKHARNIIISTPKDIGTQKDVFQNPYEIHKSQWSKSSFSKFKEKFFVPNIDSVIVFIGEDALEVKKKCGNFLIKLKFMQIFLALIYCCRFFKKLFYK